MGPLVRATCWCAFAVGVGQTCAQSFDLSKEQRPTAELKGLWRFHPGDDPGWASPNFDDSQWRLLRSDKDWAGQGYKGMSGMAWYRFKVMVPADSPPLSIYMPHMMTSYEIFADGVRIGALGGMPPAEHATSTYRATFRLPPASSGAHTVSIALRVWQWPVWASYYGGGPYGAAMIGASSLMDERQKNWVITTSWSQVDAILLASFQGVAALTALGLFLMRRREREFLWFGVMQIFLTAQICFLIWIGTHMFGVLARDNIVETLGLAGTLASMAFYKLLLGGKRDGLFWLALVTTIVSGPCGFADGVLLSVKQTDVLLALLSLPYTVWVLVLLVRAASKGLADARLLLAPVALQQLASLVGSLVWLSFQAGWQQKYLQGDLTLSRWPFEFTLIDVVDVLFLLAMLAILIGRFTRTRREEERYAGELEAARTVQHVLVPEDAADVPGFAISSVYKPASEVGGDFFQIVPLADVGVSGGGVLVAVGDVSGKGLQAAMMVSLIVGTLRTLVEQTQRPAKILEGLNRRLYGRSSGGFTTCLVMVAGADGALTVATAGHLAPYRDGKELVLDDGLPLGLTLDATYAEARFWLEPGEQLTLISDGVLEARSAAGELFGFERTRVLSTEDAAQIASTAQAFGQEDDITVLTIERMEEPAAQREFAVASV